MMMTMISTLHRRALGIAAPPSAPALRARAGAVFDGSVPDQEGGERAEYSHIYNFIIYI